MDKISGRKLFNGKVYDFEAYALYKNEVMLTANSGLTSKVGYAKFVPGNYKSFYNAYIVAFDRAMTGSKI